MIQDDTQGIQSVVAQVIGWDLTKAAIGDDGLKHPLEEAPSIWNSDAKPRCLQLNSNFNLVYSNWNCSAKESNISHVSSGEISSPELYLPPSNGKNSQIFTPLYKKDYQFGYSSSYTYQQKPKGSGNNLANTSPSNGDLVLSPLSIYVPQGSRFFVIKSYTEEDVKTSFMYKVWSSTDLGNKRLNKAYFQRSSNERIFLFFSVNGSGKFCGVAEMLSGVSDSDAAGASSSSSASDQSSISMSTSPSSTSSESVIDDDIWLDKSRWKGKFKVQWICIKDVHNNHFRHFKVPQNEFKPVTNSRDTQELPFELGQEMLEVFKNVRSNTSFLQNLSNSQ